MIEIMININIGNRLKPKHGGFSPFSMMNHYLTSLEQLSSSVYKNGKYFFIVY